MFRLFQKHRPKHRRAMFLSKHCLNITSLRIGKHCIVKKNENCPALIVFPGMVCLCRFGFVHKIGLEPEYWEKLSTVEISWVRFHLITLKFDSRSLYVFAAIGEKFNVHNPSNRRSNEICANSSGEHSSC